MAHCLIQLLSEPSLPVNSETAVSPRDREKANMYTTKVHKHYAAVLTQKLDHHSLNTDSNVDNSHMHEEATT